MVSLNDTIQNGKGINSSPQGVKINPVEYMGLGVDYIMSITGIKVASYFANLINALENVGYLRGKDLMASYDWRLTPDYLKSSTSFYEDLTQLIETTSRQNGGKKVVVVAHSLGNILFSNYLNERNEKWKDKYIRHYLAISAPWKGVVRCVRDLLSGDSIVGDTWYNNLFGTFNRNRVMQLAQGYGSLTLSLPSYDM